MQHPHLYRYLTRRRKGQSKFYDVLETTDQFWSAHDLAERMRMSDKKRVKSILNDLWSEGALTRNGAISADAEWHFSPIVGIANARKAQYGAGQPPSGDEFLRITSFDLMAFYKAARRAAHTQAFMAGREGSVPNHYDFAAIMAQVLWTPGVELNETVVRRYCRGSWISSFYITGPDADANVNFDWYSWQSPFTIAERHTAECEVAREVIERRGKEAHAEKVAKRATERRAKLDLLNEILGMND